MDVSMKVSVIATVYNERESIARLLDSLAAQTRRPDEVLICDGGSRDGTAEAIDAYARRHAEALPNLRVIVQPGANISRGRNVAIAAARGPLIAATDAGVRLEPTWLANLLAPFEKTADRGNADRGNADRGNANKGNMDGRKEEAPLAVAGFFVPDAEGVFQTAMAATVLPLADEIDPNRFLPSSRSVAFTKAAWATAGGYPEWLDYCEDLLFDFAINAQRPRAQTGFAWAPNAIVHFRPRTNFSEFWRQYYRYARGDGKADLWRKRHAVRYVTYLVLLPALLGHAFFGFFARWLGWLGLLVGVVLYCRRPWQRLRAVGQDLAPAQWLAAAALVPLIRVVGDVAKMVGYPAGLWWRAQHWAEIQQKLRLGVQPGVRPGVQSDVLPDVLPAETKGKL